MSHVEITVPEVGQTTSEVTLVKWRMQMGDPVKRGDVLAELETDKMIVELESFAQGRLVEFLAREGDVVSVGTVVALVESGQQAMAKSLAGDVPIQATPASGAPSLAQAPPVDQDQTAVAEKAVRPKASPATKALAGRLGVDLQNVSGTGPDDLIIRRNVLEMKTSESPLPSSGSLVVRSPRNPIISATDLPFAGQCCFNSGAALYGEEIVMILNCWSEQWVPAFLVARSRDGLKFEIGKQSIVAPPDEYPYAGRQEGIFDTRVTPLEGWYYITYNVASALGGRVRLIRTKDFEGFEDLGFITSIDHRNCVIFPERIGGDYVRLERPNGEGSTGGDIYISYSPDLVHWGRTRLLLQKGTRYWESMKIGPGAPPLKTAAGWLVIYHGCRQHMNGIMYSAGCMLLDLADPRRVIGKMRACLMWPIEDYEFRGNVPQVVFPTAVIQRPGTDELMIYYGAADSFICLATASVSALVQRCLADGPCAPGQS